MKSKTIIFLLISMIFVLTGCSSTKKLTCETTSESNGTTTKSVLTVKIKEEKIKNINLKLDVKLPENQQQNKYYMIEQLKLKTNHVSATSDGFVADFGMGSEYFKTLGISNDATYGEIKDILTIQGYTCQNE